MLRWKTPSAICAIMISASPLPSMAQQIVEPAPRKSAFHQPVLPTRPSKPMLQATNVPLAPLVTPEQALAANPDLRPPSGRKPAIRTAALSPSASMPPIFSKKNPIAVAQRSVRRHSPARTAERAVSPEIIIRPPFVQPHNPNLYLFVIENAGSVDATAASIDLYVPQDVVINKVVPATATHTAQRVHVRLLNLKAGSKSIVEVEVSPTTEVVEFQTRMSLESVHQFVTAAIPDFESLARPISIPDKPFGPAIVSRPIVKSQTEATKAAPATKQIKPSSTQSPLLPLTPFPLVTSAPAASAPAASEQDSKTSPRVPATTPVDTSARSGKAQPANIANANAQNTIAAETQQATAAAAVEAQKTVDAKLSATVEGPVTLAENQIADFSIVVTNPNTTEATDIVVQLTVPAGLKLTVLDRDAWFDEERQTISWEISQLASGKQEAIQYKAVGQAIGQQNQKVTIGMRNVFQGKAQLVTLVSN